MSGKAAAKSPGESSAVEPAASANTARTGEEIASSRRGPLTTQLKRRIVAELAAFRTAAEVREILFDEYGRDVAAREILRYDPTRHYCAAGEALRTLFHRVRRDYVESLHDLPVAQLGYRLRRLQEMSLGAAAKGEFKVAAQLLEQAARDHGGAYSGECRTGGRAAPEPMSPEQAREEIERFLREAGRRGGDGEQ